MAAEEFDHQSERARRPASLVEFFPLGEAFGIAEVLEDPVVLRDRPERVPKIETDIDCLTSRLLV